MKATLVLGVVIAVQGALSASIPCSGDVKAKNRDGVPCYECGKSKLATPTEQWSTAGKLTASPGDFPWSVAIYNITCANEQYCGGTLISTKAVLTAAQCVTTRENTIPTPIDVSRIAVLLGHTQRSWSTTEDSSIKKLVKEIRVNPYFTGYHTNFANDIALLILDSEISSPVMPACLDFDLDQPSLYEEDAIGYVSGFGYTEECGALCSSPSEVLKYTSTKVLSFAQCFEKTQSIYKSAYSRLTPDKLCIGNGTVSPVQKGDTGGGFTLVSQGLHYVVGVSTSKLLQRNKYSFGTLVNVSYHMDWIKQNLPE